MSDRTSKASELIARWRERGDYLDTPEGAVFFIDTGATLPATQSDPVLVLHGAPTCSLDWHRVVEPLSRYRRMVLFDYLGSGHSDKPDRRYGIELHADTACSVLRHLGLERIVLLGHDLGASVAGELLRRDMEGTLPVSVAATIITVASIYVAQTPFTRGQRALLAMPDARLAIDAATPIEQRRAVLAAGLSRFFSANARVDAADLQAVCDLIVRNDGDSLLPRTIRYIEDRLANERRYTGALETHPAPLAVVWGRDDPIAVLPMVETLKAARPDTRIRILDDIGHFPMLENPGRFTLEILDALEALLGQR